MPIYGAVSMQIGASIDVKGEATGFRCAADIIYQERRIDPAEDG